MEAIVEIVEVLRFESFAYGFCFAFSMAVVRYAFGK